jgi:hypothetical protein
MPPSNARSYRWGYGKIFLSITVKGQKLENRNIFLFLLIKINFSKICIYCDRKVFKLSVIQQHGLKVAAYLFFQKVIFYSK